jgi:hypothetical protein
MNQDVAVFLVPFLLVIGCTLLTGGGLYFIDIRFLGGARQAIASLLGGAVVLAILQILLYGSATAFFNAQQLQTSACELEGESAHPEARLGADSLVLHKAITFCMKEAGYEWTGDHRHCRDAPIATNSFCYLPMEPFDRTITSIQMNLQ